MFLKSYKYIRLKNRMPLAGEIMWKDTMIFDKVLDLTLAKLMVIQNINSLSLGFYRATTFKFDIRIV